MSKFACACVTAGLLCAGAALAADTTKSSGPIPDFSSNGVSWAGFVMPPKPDAAVARTFNDFSLPSSGLGPVTDDPAHPYINNELARETNRQPTYRVANLNNPNLKPWVIDALRKQNTLALAGRQGQTREARCWETGVPAFHLNPGSMYFTQTAKEVSLFLAGRVRRIYIDAPHSKNPKPSWYGESVGHYEGDTLVVDTIGQNTQSFLDNFRTPHSDKLHVIERYRLVDNGDTLEAEVTIEDPVSLVEPLHVVKRWRKVQGPMTESRCADGEMVNPFQQKTDPLPVAAKPDF
jgi:hypothetical protein